MNKHISTIAQDALRGVPITRDAADQLAAVTGRDVHDLLYWANRIRHAHHGNRVSLCSVISAKQGSCTEDCAFCAQSAHHDTDVETYPLMGTQRILDAAREAAGIGSSRLGVVTSGESACGSEDWPRIVEAVKALVSDGEIEACASLGSLTADAASSLKAAGLKRYHHNLETSERYFPRICTTHSFQERVDTVRTAKAAGFEVCCGGLFGLGESWEDRVDMAFVLRDLDVDSVPLNFLNPIPGTPLENAEPVPPMDLLKLIALYRVVLPSKEIRVCGGREVGLRDLQSWMFHAGANGTMIGNYLTTAGRSAEDDRQMLKDLGLST